MMSKLKKESARMHDKSKNFSAVNRKNYSGMDVGETNSAKPATDQAFIDSVSLERPTYSGQASRRETISEELRLSLGSLISNSDSEERSVIKERSYQAWLARKNLELKKRKEEEKLLCEYISQELNKIDEKNRYAYLNWLAKKDEAKRKQLEKRKTRKY